MLQWTTTSGENKLLDSTTVAYPRCTFSMTWRLALRMQLCFKIQKLSGYYSRDKKKKRNSSCQFAMPRELYGDWMVLLKSKPHSAGSAFSPPVWCQTDFICLCITFLCPYKSTIVKTEWYRARGASGTKKVYRHVSLPELKQIDS